MPRHGKQQVAYAQTAVRVGGSKMQHDKQVIAVFLSDNTAGGQMCSILPGTSNAAGSLNPIVFPQTVTGFRWDFTLAADSSLTLNWAIIAIRGTQTPSIIAPQAAGALVSGTSEREVIVFGSESFITGTQVTKISGSTKVGRKLQVGDDLRLLVKPVGGNTADYEFTGVVQYFRKS